MGILGNLASGVLNLSIAEGSGNSIACEGEGERILPNRSVCNMIFLALDLFLEIGFFEAEIASGLWPSRASASLGLLLRVAVEIGVLGFLFLLLSMS